MILKSLHRSLLIAALAMPLITTGCIAESYALYKYATRVAVTYNHPDRFQCEETHIPDGTKGFATCAKCQNISAVPQRVVVADVAQEVPPRAVLMSCPG